MTTPQPENTTYKVMRLTTEGWTELDPLMAVNLTKEQCDAVLQLSLIHIPSPRD